MKNLYALLILLFLVEFSKAQTITISADGDPVGLAKVIQVDTSLKKDKLYSMGGEWFVNVFKNPKIVMQLQDKEAGVIIGKCSLSHIDTLKTALSGPIYQTTIINYMIKLSFKDGKVKLDVTNFITEAGNIINNGKINPINLPPAGLIGKKKLNAYYTTCYRHDQESSNQACIYIQKSVENFFTKKNADNNW